MGSQVYYNSPSEAVIVTPIEFVDLTTGAPADPTTVTVVVTDPTGGVTNYTYSAGSGLNAIVKASVGNYTLTIDGISKPGLYSYVWVGSGNNVQQVSPGTFRLVPLSDVGVGMTGWYTGMEELKSRLGITDHANDYEMQLAIQTVKTWIDSYCGQHFNQIAETRTFAPNSVWGCDIDPLVSTPSIVSGAQVNLDYTGNGVYNVAWTQNVEYQFLIGPPGNIRDNYNINAAGVPRPYKHIQVLTGVPGNSAQPGGGWFPWIWPYTYLNRVQVIGTWGWNVVPPQVAMASMMLSVDLYKSKDAPWGVAGVNDLGIVKVQSNPWIVELLKDFILMSRKAGV